MVVVVATEVVVAVLLVSGGWSGVRAWAGLLTAGGLVCSGGGRNVTV